MDMYSVDENEIVWRKAGPEMVILNLSNGHYYTLNETGALVWDGILGKDSPSAIAQRLTECFDIDYETAFQDTFDCIQSLTGESIISLQGLDLAEAKSKPAHENG